EGGDKPRTEGGNGSGRGGGDKPRPAGRGGREFRGGRSLVVATKKMTSDELLDQFKEMTLLELNEFVKKFEEAFEVQAAAPMMGAMVAAPGGGGAAAAEEAEEQFDVVLAGAGDKKIQVIKEVRA